MRSRRIRTRNPKQKSIRPMLHQGPPMFDSNRHRSLGATLNLSRTIVQQRQSSVEIQGNDLPKRKRSHLSEINRDF